MNVERGIAVVTIAAGIAPDAEHEIFERLVRHWSSHATAGSVRRG